MDRSHRFTRYEPPSGRPIVAVFGSSTLVRSDPGWAHAEELGERLGAAGFTIMNGGYAGAMEAVSVGARRAGADVIGVTTALFHERTPNLYLTHQEHTSDLLQRLDYLMHAASGFVALEGSIGTLAEVFLAWNLLAVEGRPSAPLVLLGQSWLGFLDDLRDSGWLASEMFGLVQHATDPEHVVAILRADLAAGR